MSQSRNMIYVSINIHKCNGLCPHLKINMQRHGHMIYTRKCLNTENYGHLLSNNSYEVKITENRPTNNNFFY